MTITLPELLKAKDSLVYSAEGYALKHALTPIQFWTAAAEASGISLETLYKPGGGGLTLSQRAASKLLASRFQDVFGLSRSTWAANPISHHPNWCLRSAEAVCLVPLKAKLANRESLASLRLSPASSLEAKAVSSASGVGTRRQVAACAEAEAVTEASTVKAEGSDAEEAELMSLFERAKDSLEYRAEGYPTEIALTPKEFWSVVAASSSRALEDFYSGGGGMTKSQNKANQVLRLKFMVR